jgi:hypothetical protein
MLRSTLSMQALGRNFVSASPKGVQIGSKEAIQHVLEFVPRSEDVIIATPPKTGTTLLQQMCHQLRTGGDDDFHDVHEIAPYMPQAYDMGLDLNDEQKANPRLFKAHSPISNMPEGCNYIVTARDPNEMVMSAFNHYTTKFESMKFDVPTFIQETLNAEGFFGIVREGFLRRDESNVLFLTYEDLLNGNTKEQCVHRVADFMGIGMDQHLLDLTMHLSSKKYMLEHVSKFDNSWSVMMLAKHARNNNSFGGCAAKPSPKVTDRPKMKMPQECEEIIDEYWYELVGQHIGLNSHEDMVMHLRDEAPQYEFGVGGLSCLKQEEDAQNISFHFQPNTSKQQSIDSM